MKSLLVALVILGVATGQAKTLRLLPVRVTSSGLPAGIRFYCDKEYNRDNCAKHIAVLRDELARYPIEDLGGWSFVVASSSGWKETLCDLGSDPRTPAFTLVDDRITIFEEALFETMPVRDVEL